MAFGQSGGRGGFGSSFPVRGSAPNSNVVESLPFATRDEWQADWQRRFDELKNAGPQAAQAPATNIYNGPDGWNLTTSGGSLDRPVVPTMDNLGSFMSPFSSDPFASTGERPTAATPDNIGTYGMTPQDFTSLEAERARMPGMYDAFERNTQAYNNMGGRGMMNGILSEAYSSPDYGRVNTAGAGTGSPDTAGVNMSWTGRYDPSTGSGAVGQRRRWGQ